MVRRPTGQPAGPSSLFLAAARRRYGITSDDWRRIEHAIATTRAIASDDPLYGATPYLFVSSRFHRNRDSYFALFGLALDMGAITAADLPQTVLLDSPRALFIMTGVAIPWQTRGKVAWDTSRLQLVISSRLDPGSLPLHLRITTVQSGAYLIVERQPIRDALPALYTYLDHHGLFYRIDRRTGATIQNVFPHTLLHRLVVAAAGYQVLGYEVDHTDQCTGAFYGGPPTFDARMETLRTLTPTEHRAITKARADLRRSRITA